MYVCMYVCMHGCVYVWYGMVMVWYGMVWYGMVWYGMVWYGMVWYSMVWYLMLCYVMLCYVTYVCVCAHAFPPACVQTCTYVCKHVTLHKIACLFTNWLKPTYGTSDTAWARRQLLAACQAAILHVRARAKKLLWLQVRDYIKHDSMLSAEQPFHKLCYALDRAPPALKP